MEVDHTAPPYAQGLHVPHANAVITVQLPAARSQRSPKAALIYTFPRIRSREGSAFISDIRLSRDERLLTSGKRREKSIVGDQKIGPVNGEPIRPILYGATNHI